VAGLLLLGVSAVLAYQLSPWPRVLLIRWVFDRGALDASTALERHLPAGLVERLDVVYDPNDPDARLDLYMPAPRSRGPQPLLVVVWVHGGGFVSGRKEDIRNYARILAGHGLAVAGVGYGIAPATTWPTPAHQVNAATGFLRREAAALDLEPVGFVLAGDSAGAQIAAELANALTSPAHADRLGLVPALSRHDLRGALLYCGPYDAGLIDWTSPFAGFLRTALWAYMGRKDFLDDPRLGVFSVTRHLSPAFPPSFISAGNGDPLLAHSQALAEALRGHGVDVETLFFPDALEPALGHEYQFDLDTDAGRQALVRSVDFLKRRAADPGPAGASAGGPSAPAPAADR
jgi:acetyl esterase/lipase